MQYRVRAAAIIFSQDKQSLLLIKHVHPRTGETWWVPPGGAVEESDENIFHTAERETFEESNLIIKTSKAIRYIREFYETGKGLLHLEDSFWEQTDPTGTYLERQCREVLL